MHSLRRSNCAFHTQSRLSKSENSMKSYQRVLTDPLVSEIMSTWPGAIIKMQDQDHIEIESMYAAADKGGAYLDAIGQTDLSKLNHGQWMTFIETIIREFETTRTKMTVEMPF